MWRERRRAGRDVEVVVEEDDGRWPVALTVLAWLGVLAVIGIELAVAVLVAVDVLSVPVVAVFVVAVWAAVIAMVVAAARRRHVWLYAAGVGALVVVTSVGALVSSFDGATGRTIHRAASPDGIAAEYRNAIGHLTVDVGDIELDDDRTLTVDGGIGRVDVIVPDDVELSVGYEIQAGELRVDDRTAAEGWDVRGSRTFDVRGERPTLAVDVDMAFGQIAVCRAADVLPSDPDECPIR